MSGTEYERIGRYHIIRHAGKGGYGEVYEGWDAGAKRSVALKVLSHARPDDLIRFQREAAITAQLSRELLQVAQIYECSYDARLKLHYLAEEYLSGVDLSKKIGDGDRLPMWLRLSYLTQIAAALEEIHRHDVIHRDLKPGNIRILHDHRIKLMDFGIAKNLNDTEVEITLPGYLLGTPLYAAPEQVHDTSRAGKSADVYAFGVIAFELLAGRHPLDRAEWPNRAELSEDLRQMRPNVRAHQPDCPQETAEIVERCMAYDADDRPSLAQVRMLLTRAMDHSAVMSQAAPDAPTLSISPPTNPTAEPDRPRRAVPAWVSIVGASLFLLLGLWLGNGLGGGGASEPVSVSSTEESASSDDEWILLEALRAESGVELRSVGAFDAASVAHCRVLREPAWETGGMSFSSNSVEASGCLRDGRLSYVDDLKLGGLGSVCVYRVELLDAAGEKILETVSAAIDLR